MTFQKPLLMRSLESLMDEENEIRREATSPAAAIRPMVTVLREHRAEIQAAAEAIGAKNIRIFGSVARGEERSDSDVDLLVDFPAGERGLVPLLKLAGDIEGIVGRRIDLAAAEIMEPHIREHAQAEAIPL